MYFVPVLPGADAGADASGPFDAGSAPPARDADVLASDAGDQAELDASADAADGAQTQPADASHADASPGSVPAPVPHGCISDVSAGARTVACDGISHALSVPESCLATQCGLILDVHGGTMSGAMEELNTQLAALGRKHGYVVIQPNAAAGLFNALNDDTKVRAFAESAIAAFHLDPKRVHMTGFSQGGYMTWRFICQHHDLLASAAPAAAAGPAKISLEADCSFSGDERPSTELDILYMHGTQDGLVDFANAEVKREAVRSAYGMDEGAQIAGDAAFTRTRFTNERGTVFEFIQHDYTSPSAVGTPPFGVAIAGHCYPGSQDFVPSLPGQLMGFGCDPPVSFHWGEEVIAFFMAHPKE